MGIYWEGEAPVEPFCKSCLTLGLRLGRSLALPLKILSKFKNRETVECGTGFEFLGGGGFSRAAAAVQAGSFGLAAGPEGRERVTVAERVRLELQHRFGPRVGPELLRAFDPLVQLFHR